MVDIHCHILPALDDGAKSLDESVEMAEMAIADGITHVVATPHASMRNSASISIWCKSGAANCRRD